MKILLRSAICILFFSSIVCAMGRRPPAGAKDNIVEQAGKEKNTSEQAVNTEKKLPLPVYISELSNINDYFLFANGGWDGNWYVGYNVCWMEQLQKPPLGEYVRAYIGAKLGRMKTRAVAGKPIWEKEPIPGDIYIAIASTPAWKSYQSYFLTSTKYIPLEGDPENALEGIGESQWFWVEVPMPRVNLGADNFVALFSPTPELNSIGTSPSLAGGWGSQTVNSWMSSDISGAPPITAASSLKTPITVFEPAIAMKLIPKGSEQNIFIEIAEIKPGKRNTPNKTFALEVYGQAIRKVWMECSVDGKKWAQYGRAVYTPPYTLTLKPGDFGGGSVKIRFVATDVWENAGYSKVSEIVISK
jgi:hypothetical protein